jgi:hypothetical protein
LKADAPASIAEIKEAEQVADAIATRLQSVWPFEPFRVMSGNGIHLYLPLDDVPNDPEFKELCRQFLIDMDQFETATIKVDKVVYNASRITKVPGTIARKGIEADGRPYRMAIVL